MKFSIIVPVYGVEKYLDECVKSILAQTFRDFELILVDDKSPDNCPKMCDDYAVADSRIKVIHKEQNEGPGYARNTGLEFSKGDYVIFVDSDDYVDSCMLEKCNKELKKDTEIMVFGMKVFQESAKGKRKYITELSPDNFVCNNSLSKAETFARLYKNRVFQYVWNKVYLKDFLISCGVKYKKTSLMEDFLFNIEVFKSAEKIKLINESFYFYRKPQHETLTTKYFPEFFESTKRKYKLEQEFLRNCENGNEHENVIIESYVKHLVSAAIRNQSKSANLSKAEQKALIKEMMDDAVTIEALNEFAPSRIKFKLLTKMIKNRQVKRFYFFCRLIKVFKLK